MIILILPKVFIFFELALKEQTLNQQLIGVLISHGPE
jgi:hypothetical protein